MDIETKRVNSIVYRLYRLFFFISLCFLYLFGGLTGGRTSNMIERDQIQWFFKDWQTFNVWAVYFFMIASAFSAFFGFKYFTHHLGTFRLNDVRLYADKTVFPFDQMKGIKLSINSPGVFGNRNVRRGFKNWIEFSIDGERKKYEFYIKNQAIEDTLMNLITELKNRHSIELIIDKRSKESLFESWFGEG